MINLSINKIVLFLCFIFFTNSHADTKLKTSNIVAEPIMQAGGYSNISNAKLQQLLDNNVLLIDIRRKEEWQQTGIVKGSKTITFFDKTGRVNNDFVPKFTAFAKPDQPVILICRTGNRTKAASEALVKHLGYKNVMNVTDGITRWIAEKRPVVKYSSTQ